MTLKRLRYFPADFRAWWTEQMIRWFRCDDCDGDGWIDLPDGHWCPRCRGRGWVWRKR